MKKYLALFVIVLVWGFYYLAVDLSLKSGWDPHFMNAVRFLIAASVFVPILIWKNEIGDMVDLFKRKWLPVIVTSFVGLILGIGFLTIGQETVSSGISGVIASTSSLWAAVIGFFVFWGQEKLGRKAWAGVFIGLVGIISLYSPWSGASLSLLGVTLLLAGSFFLGFEAHLILRWFARESAVSVTALLVLASSIMFFIVAIFIGSFQAGAIMPVIFLAVFSASLVYLVYVWLVVDSGPTFANTYAYLIPAVALLAGAFLNHEPVTAFIIIGSLLCLQGAILVGSNSEVISD